MSSNPGDEDYDEAYGFHTGFCRGCKKDHQTLSNDDGICTDCN